MSITNTVTNLKVLVRNILVVKPTQLIGKDVFLLAVIQPAAEKEAQQFRGCCMVQQHSLKRHHAPLFCVPLQWLHNHQLQSQTA